MAREWWKMASRKMRRARILAKGVGYVMEGMEGRVMLSGVTLITHGFGSGADSWMRKMADDIAAREGIDATIYKMIATDGGIDGAPITVSKPDRLTGPFPELNSTDNPEIVLLLDWSAMSGQFAWKSDFLGHHRSTASVAKAVADKLVTDNLISGIPNLLSLPLHFIGHSRGGSLVAELAKILGQRQILIDQVTTLDPHPVNGIKEPLGVTTNWFDTEPAHWSNIEFFDNYWRDDDRFLHPLDFVGQIVPQTYSVELNESALDAPGGPDRWGILSIGDPGYWLEHSDVHLWYHGTIKPNGVVSDG